MTEENSLFLTEGKNLLIEEFGKEYTVYFSILECISRGLTSRGDIETASVSYTHLDVYKRQMVAVLVFKQSL